MEPPSRHVLYLAKKIGARAPGSDGEAAAASYVLRTFSNLDIEVNMETFRSWKSDMHGLLIVMLLSLFGYAIFPASYITSLVCGILAWVIFQMEVYSWAVTSRLMPRSSSSNVIGRIHPAGEKKHRVMLVANYDSAKESPLGRPRVARLYRVIFALVFVCVSLLALLAIVGMLISLADVKRSTILLLWMFTAPFAAYMLILTALLGWGELFGRYSAGANDNAAGVGVMLSVMEKMADKPLQHTDLWAVATARGAAGGRGMISLMKRHRRQFHGTYIINIDHPGGGRLSVIRREGVILGFRGSGKLTKLAMQAAKKEKLEIKRGRCRVKKSDAMVARVRGQRAITIGGLVGGTFPGYRNTHDTYDDIDREMLDDARSLVERMLRLIDVLEK